MAEKTLNRPCWAGKALGAAGALILGPAEVAPLLWWLAGGIVAGQMVDTMSGWLSRLAGGELGPSATFTFLALGRLARVGGPVRPAHIRCAEELLCRWNLQGPRRRRAIGCFRSGKRDADLPLSAAPDHPLPGLAPACRRALAGNPVLEDDVLDVLCRMTLVEDTPQRRHSLFVLGRLLDVPDEALRCRLDGLAEAQALNEAYALLGVGASDGEHAVKTAYRRLVARCHPDRLPPSADTGAQQAAASRMNDLRSALERIEAARAA
jgi:DnaJ like chaperone protein